MLYWLSFPIVLYVLVFSYIPMTGLFMAFQDYDLKDGLLGSRFIGLQNFISFFHSIYFIRTLRNTVLISFYDLIFSFPAPIILALLMNEISKQWFKNTLQTIIYLPHFISLVVIAGLIIDFTASTGFVAEITAKLGGTGGNLLSRPEAFRTIFVSTNVWQSIGFNSIIYLAALSSVNRELYEAARMDGAGRLRQCWNITLPGISPTVITMLILRVGQLMNVNFEKIMLLYSPANYETADVISTYVYRQGILNQEFGYSTAVGLFNSVIGFIMIVAANSICKRCTDTALF